MKKLSLTLLIPIIFALLSSQAKAAMTCSISDVINDSPTLRTTNLLCSFNTTPGTAVYTLTSTQMGQINARRVHHIATIPGSTAPTDNSDLQIKDSRGITFVGATGTGANVIDNATSNIFTCDGVSSGTDITAYSVYPLTITVTNNAVNNSSFTLSIESVRTY